MNSFSLNPACLGAVGLITAQFGRDYYDGSGFAITADGYRTKVGNPWSKAAVLTVLRNRTYLGEIWFRDRWYKAENHHPAIISEKLFTDAQDILDARGDETGHRAVANSDYTLAGRLFCTKCGNSMDA